MARAKATAAAIRTVDLRDSSSEEADLRRDEAVATVTVAAAVGSNDSNLSHSLSRFSVSRLLNRCSDNRHLSKFSGCRPDRRVSRNVSTSSQLRSKFIDNPSKSGDSSKLLRHIECPQDKQRKWNAKLKLTFRHRFMTIPDAEMAVDANSEKT